MADEHIWNAMCGIMVSGRALDALVEGVLCGMDFKRRRDLPPGAVDHGFEWPLKELARKANK